MPQLVLDATTTAEDRTFWENDGFDPAAIVAAAVQNAIGRERAASAAHRRSPSSSCARDSCPREVVDAEDRYMRKILEVLQASRLTAAFPGEAGKERIITAYLNEIYYGHRGVRHRRRGEHLLRRRRPRRPDARPGRAPRGPPKAPSVYDPYRYAVEDAEGRLVVPADSPPVVRRDYVLRDLAAVALDAA